jgi:hypothetical protein
VTPPDGTAATVVNSAHNGWASVKELTEMREPLTSIHRLWHEVQRADSTKPGEHQSTEPGQIQWHPGKFLGDRQTIGPLGGFMVRETKLG